MVITCATGKDIISIVAVDGVITAITIDDIIIIGAGYIIITVRHSISKAHFGQIFDGTICELQVFNTTVVIVELVIKLNSLCLISIYINIQMTARTLKSQVIKRNTFSEFDFIGSAFGGAVLIIGKRIEPVT